MNHRLRDAIKKQELKVDREDRKEWPKFSDEDRMKLYRRCGDKCFLVVKGTAQEIITSPKKTLKFPVCRVPVRKDKCVLSAAGLLAANRRARLTKKYPELVQETKKMIQELGTTAKSRKMKPVSQVRLKQNPTDPKTFIVSVVYEQGIKETMKTPMTPRMIKNRYNDILSDCQKKRLGLL